MDYAGPRTVGVCGPMVMTVTVTDQARGSFFDVLRPGQDARRQVLDPGQVFTCRLLAGPADVVLGACTGVVFEPEGDDDGGVVSDVSSGLPVPRGD